MGIKAPSFANVDEMIKFINNNWNDIILDMTKYYRDKIVEELEERDGPVADYYERHGLDTPPYEHIVEYQEYDDEAIDEYLLEESRIGEEYNDYLEQLVQIIKNNADWINQLLNDKIDNVDDLITNNQDPITIQAQKVNMDLDVITYFYETICW